MADHTQIRKQIEFYFGDANLSRDSFLQEKIAEDRNGFVTIACLLTFKKLASMTSDAAVIVESLKDSETLEVSEDKLSIKRKTPLDASIDFSKYSVMLYPVPAESGEAEVRAAIADFCDAADVAAIWRKRKKHPETKLPVSIAEIHCASEAAAAALLEKSEKGKKIAFPSNDVLDESEVDALLKPDFEALYSKKQDNSGRPKPKGADFTIEDVKAKVIDLTAEVPIGVVKYIKNIPHESIRAGILYAHVMEGEKNRMLVLFETAEGCAEALKAYADAEVEVKPTEGDDAAKSTKITPALVEDEGVLETVLGGFKERMMRNFAGKKSFGKRRGKAGFQGNKRRRA